MEKALDAVNPVACPDERRRVFGDDRCLPEEFFAVAVQKSEHLTRGFGSRDYFKQLQVPRRIEEVGPAEMLLEVVRSSVAHKIDRNPGRVRGDQRSRFPEFFNFLENLLLDLELFNDNFYNPVGARNFSYVIGRVACGNPRGELLAVNRRGL